MTKAFALKISMKALFFRCFFAVQQKQRPTNGLVRQPHYFLSLCQQSYSSPFYIMVILQENFYKQLL